MRRVVILWSVILVLLAGVAVAADDKEELTSDVSLLVLRQTNGKPVRNATVVLHTVDQEGKQSKGGINLKTDSEGQTEYRGIPYGKLRVQVIARGFQTFGEDFDISQPTQKIEIKLAPPKEQFSIYK